MRRALCEWVGYSPPVPYTRIQDNSVVADGDARANNGASAVLGEVVAATEGE